MSREVRNRVTYGVMIPLLAAVFIAAVLFSLSRILLAVDPDVAPWIGLGFAMNILVGSALAAILPGRRAFAFLAGVIVLTIVAGGVAGAMVGEWPVHSLVEEAGGEEGPGGGATPGEEETTPAEEETTPAEEETTPAEEADVTVVAENIAFDTGTLSLPFGEPSTIAFESLDPVPHNVAIYTEQGGESLFAGDLITQDTVTYEVPPLDAGSYFFQCDVHPTEMTGTVEVG